jgi:hypothetical protein
MQQLRPRRVVTGEMRRRLAPMLLAGLLAGCTGAPDAVRPTLKALAHRGYACGDGIKDNVPSGLYQWKCARDGTPETIVDIDGNDRGVAELDIVVRDTETAHVRQAFAEIVAAVPPLSSAPWLAGGLDGWTGPQASWDLNGVHVTGLCDATQCIVIIVTAASPIEPLPLP